MRRFLLLFALFLTATVPAVAGTTAAKGDVESYKFDIGASLGMSGYLGDANASNMFAKPGFAGTVSFRYLAGTRFAVRALVNVASLSGNSAKYSNVFPDNAVFDFKGTVYDLEARAEFNFFPYGIGETYKRLRRWTPYLALGLGGAVTSCGGTTGFGLTLPMAVGFKFKVKPRFNLFAEFAMVKMFTDKADNIVDPYQIKSSFFKNTDWYSALTVGFSFEFGPRCTVCHRID